MRDIEFRGKRIDNNEWIFGNLIQPMLINNTVERRAIINNKIEGQLEYLDLFIDEKTVSQYVGLKDKNDNKIFEGDIVKLKSGGGLFNFGAKEFIGVVKFKNGGGIRSTLCQFYIETINDPHNEADFNPQNIEIIGNIYDNKELLTNGGN